MSHPHKNDVYICNKNFHAIFSVDELIKFSKQYDIVEIDIHNLKSAFYNSSNCIADYDTQKRINNADISYPIIVVSNKKQKIIAVLDGTHRIRKAIQLGLKVIKAIIIPKKDMKKFKSSKKLGQIIVDCSLLGVKELKLLQSLLQDYLEKK